MLTYQNDTALKEKFVQHVIEYCQLVLRGEPAAELAAWSARSAAYLAAASAHYQSERNMLLPLIKELK